MNTLQTRRWARTARVVAAVVGGGAALAQVTPKVLTDVAPLPAEERSSAGAIVLMDQPVLAQREMMQNLAGARLQTSTMGAGPAPVLRRTLTKQELDALRAAEAAEFHKRGAGALFEK